MENQSLTGLIDFGDMVYSARIIELAVNLSYVLAQSDDIFQDTATIVKTYHKGYPLKKAELDLLYLLIAGRVITSLVNSAKGKIENPDNEYIQISEKPYRHLLKKWITINPITIKNIAYQACGFTPESTRALKDKMSVSREQHFTSALSLSYDKPIYMASAAFQHMYDLDGNSYLDAYNNIPLVGHAHPAISKVASQQFRKLNTNTRYHYTQLSDYTNKLLSYFPKRLNKIYFVNSGSAASDLAIRLATNYTNQKNIFVLEDGYHGNTQIGIEISPYKHDKKGGKGKASYIHHFPLPKEFNNNQSVEEMTNTTIQKIETLAAENLFPAAFIAEPISGCGGQVPIPKQYLQEVFAKVKTLNGVCIVDEVQLGFGRLGSWFWGFQMLEVEPDIVILGKPIGNGHPMAAVVCTEEIADSFNNGMEFFSSFGGNPISCAIGHEVLNILERENLQENARAVGNYWKDELRNLQTQFPILADIRGEGLFLGIELMQDNQPATEIAKDIKNKMKDSFILTSTDGKYNNVLKMKPPLCFTKENVDQFCDALKKVLATWY